MPVREPEGRRAYPTTHWSQIYLASQTEPQAGMLALDRLLRSYEPPLRQHLPAKFHAPEDQARDWFQGFVEQKILCKRLLEKAREERGRFCTFVLNALDNYVLDEIAKASSGTRRPPAGWVGLDEASETAPTVEGGPPPNPDDVAWAQRVWEQAMARTQAFYEQQGRLNAWAVFCGTWLVPRSERPSSAELAKQHGFASGRQGDGAIETVKRYFGKQLRAVTAEYVEDESQIEEEVRELIAILGGSG